MPAHAKAKKVKSACRVLEVLEIFNRDVREASVMEIARRLDYPQSSTSELLGCLVNEGYLIRDRWRRTYRPSARTALLGAWVQPSRFRDGKLLPLIDALHAETGHAVVIAAMQDVHVTHLHAVGSENEASIRSGTEHHLLSSPFGIALMTCLPREHARKITHRVNAENDMALRVSFDELAAQLDLVARRGFAVAKVNQDLAAVTMLLPQEEDDEQLAIGIVAPAEQVNDDCVELARYMRGAISRFMRTPDSCDRDVPASRLSLAC